MTTGIGQKKNNRETLCALLAIYTNNKITNQQILTKNKGTFLSIYIFTFLMY